MIIKVALHSRCQDLFPEVADFQACGDGLAKEFVVSFDLFVRGFYKDFPMFVAEAHQEVGVSEHGVDLRLREYIHVIRKALVIPSDLIEAVGDGVVGDESALRGEEDAALAVGAQPHDLPKALPYDLPGVELPSVLDVPGLLDGGAAADDISAVVPDQLSGSGVPKRLIRV